MDNIKDGLEKFPGFGKGIVKRTNELLDSEAKGLFLGWFNNRMGMILMAIQHIKAKDPKSIASIEFFLHDLEHHFVAGNKPALNAFRYLRRFFKVYPNVTLAHSKKALERLKQIYDALGLELETSGFSPKLSEQERVNRKIKGYLHEILTPSKNGQKTIVFYDRKRKLIQQKQAISEIVFRQRIRAAIFYLLYVLEEYSRLPQNEKEDITPFAIETSYLLGRLLDGSSSSAWTESFAASQSIQRYFKEVKEIDKVSAERNLQSILSQLHLDSDSEKLQPAIQSSVNNPSENAHEKTRQK